MDLITQRMKLKDAFPLMDIADLQTQYEIKEEPEFVRKGLIPESMTFEEGEHAIITYITTGAKDRDGEVVNPKGGMLKEFKANPVVLWGHDSKSLPIGRCDKIVSDEKGLIAKTVYASHPFAEQVYQYRKEGFPLACSIGFIPLKTTKHEEGSEEYLKGISRTYDKWLLLEYSECPVPSNPEALALAVSKGLLTQEQAKEYILVSDDSVEKEVSNSKEHDEEGTPDTSKLRAGDVKIEQDSSSSLNLEGLNETDIEQVQAFAESLKVDKPGWDETDNMIRHRVREPGLFVDGSFRTVPIKRDKPRVNSVMGKLKVDADPKPMKVQNLMFPKADGWTMTTAKAWASAHPDLLKWMDESEVFCKFIESDLFWMSDIDVLKLFDKGDVWLKKELELSQILSKSFDLKGNPSAWDIAESINSLLESPVGMGRYKYVIDLYPVNYPNGHVIISVQRIGEERKFYQYDYTYSNKIAVLSDEFIEIEQGYRPKHWIEDKSGRTLSAATRKTMNTAVEAMNNAVTALTELLNTSDTPQNDAEGGKGILIQDDDQSSEIGVIWNNTDKELKTTISEAVKRALPPVVNIRESAKEGIYSLLGKV